MEDFFNGDICGNCDNLFGPDKVRLTYRDTRDNEIMLQVAYCCETCSDRHSRILLAVLRATVTINKEYI